MFLRCFAAILLCLLLIIPGACAKNTETPAPVSPGDTEVMAVVGGDTILRAEFEYLLTTMLSEYITYTGSSIDWDAEIDGKSAPEHFRDMALERAVSVHTILQKAGAMGIALTPREEADINAYIGQEIEYTGGREAFDAYLSALGTDEATHVLYNYRAPLLSEKLYATLFGEGGQEYPDEAALRAFYEAHFTTLSYIYLSALDMSGNLLEDDARLLRREAAEALWEEAGNGADFMELIRRHGEDYLMLLTPEGLCVPKGQNGAAFDEAAARLAVGEISPVVDANEGFYIILRQPEDPAWYGENKDAVLFEYKNNTFTSLVRAWCEEIGLTTTDAYRALDTRDYAPKG